MNDGGSAVEIALQNGGVALVSPEDVERVSALKWRLGANGYAYCCDRSQKHALLHRFVVDADPSLEVHHDNEIKLDCRRSNLIQETPADHQRKHHAESLRKRNEAQRVYPAVRACEGCGIEFEVNPDHRGRNRFCTRTCGNKNRPRPGRKAMQHG